MSDLCWIRNEEKLLDSIVKLGAGSPANSAELDLTIPATDVDPSAWASAAPASVSQLVPGPRRAPASSGLAASAPSPHLQPEDCWLLLGAKPKLVPAATVVSTPNPKHRSLNSTPRYESWYVASGRKACKTSRQSPCELQLSKRYDALSLDDFSPLTRWLFLSGLSPLVLPPWRLWLVAPSRLPRPALPSLRLQLVLPPSRLQQSSPSLQPLSPLSRGAVHPAPLARQRGAGCSGTWYDTTRWDPLLAATSREHPVPIGSK
ncbi:hypothetical protein ABVT39_012420 [Epinephelus coioides]